MHKLKFFFRNWKVSSKSFNLSLGWEPNSLTDLSGNTFSSFKRKLSKYCKRKSCEFIKGSLGISMFKLGLWEIVVTYRNDYRNWVLVCNNEHSQIFLITHFTTFLSKEKMCSWIRKSFEYIKGDLRKSMLKVELWKEMLLKDWYAGLL